jgi:hypothetical protein
MSIDIELAKHILQQFQKFEYKVGDCLFDSIAYLLNCSISLELIRKNSFQKHNLSQEKHKIKGMF